MFRLKKMSNLFSINSIFAIAKDMAFLSVKMPLRQNLLVLCPEASQDSGELAAPYVPYQKIKAFLKITFVFSGPPIKVSIRAPFFQIHH